MKSLLAAVVVLVMGYQAHAALTAQEKCMELARYGANEGNLICNLERGASVIALETYNRLVYNNAISTPAGVTATQERDRTAQANSNCVGRFLAYCLRTN